MAVETGGRLNRLLRLTNVVTDPRAEGITPTVVLRISLLLLLLKTFADGFVDCLRLAGSDRSRLSMSSSWSGDKRCGGEFKSPAPLMDDNSAATDRLLSPEKRNGDPSIGL